MARQERQAEGDNAQRRKTAKEARDRGRRPSEVGATLGASKQRKEARRQASHQERLEQKREGKRSRRTDTQARPGNREIDPNRG